MEIGRRLEAVFQCAGDFVTRGDEICLPLDGSFLFENVTGGDEIAS